MQGSYKLSYISLFPSPPHFCSPPFQGGGWGGGYPRIFAFMNKLYFGDNLVILKDHIAVSEGYYESPMGKSYPKIQILTIEELLNNTARAEFPDLTAGR